MGVIRLYLDMLVNRFILSKLYCYYDYFCIVQFLIFFKNNFFGKVNIMYYYWDKKIKVI